MNLDDATQEELQEEVFRLLMLARTVLKHYPMREVVTEVFAELAYDPDDDPELGREWLKPFVDRTCERLAAAGYAHLFREDA